MKSLFYLLFLNFIFSCTPNYKNIKKNNRGTTLAEIKKRGKVNCIINTGLPGFASPDDKGYWKGFDIDFCRAVAAAVLKDRDKVNFITATGKNRFTKLNSKEGDLIFRNTTITFTRDVDVKMNFVGVNYYDGQGFMVPKKLKIKSSKNLNGVSVCIQTGTTTELNLADYFSENKMKYKGITVETNAEAKEAFLAGRCDVYTTDASGLASSRASFKKPDDYMILPEIISKEPLGPAVREGDEKWADIVRWVLNATIIADELGLTSKNIDVLLKDSNNSEIQRLLGKKGNQGEQLGLDNEWAYRVLKQVGNYGEIFARNIGEKTPLALKRGLNKQWNKGGLLYAPPFR